MNDKQPVLLVILQCPYKKRRLQSWNPGIWRKEFLISQTGRRLLRKIIPNNLFRIRIRNANPCLADTPDGIFPANISYLKHSICQIKPDIVLACGRVAQQAISHLNPQIPVINIPHPAYRRFPCYETEKIQQQLKHLAKNKQKYIYCWGNNEKRKIMKGRKCVVLAYSRMNSAKIQFLDNKQIEIVARRALRKTKEE